MKDVDFADGIYWILDAINDKLGGGYDSSAGIDYRNDVFETFSFWNHCECTCSYGTREMDWEEGNPHGDDCYQTLIRTLGFGYSYETGRTHEEQKAINNEATHQACVSLGVNPDAPGRYVHCTCNRDDRYVDWRRSAKHDPDCKLEDVGFRHFGSGLEVSWYKRVGRSTESNNSMKTLDWFRVVTECLESVRDDDTARS